MAGLLELLISTVALLVLSDASFEWVLQTIWNILMNNHVHGTLKICCSFLEVSPEVIFVESDPWTSIAYKLGFSYVNDILWKIFFDSFLRSDWIQKKKKHLAENSIALFLCHHRWFHERIVGQSQDFPENRKRNSVSGKFSRDRVTKTD